MKINFDYAYDVDKQKWNCLVASTGTDGMYKFRASSILENTPTKDILEYVKEQFRTLDEAMALENTEKPVC